MSSASTNAQATAEASARLETGVQPIRVLLYSIKGAGLHYTGGGMTAYRMYSSAPPGRFRITLAHTRADQGEYGLFENTAAICSFENDPLSQWRTMRHSVQWVRDHASQFDVFHGLHAYHVTTRTAYEAQRRGLPAVLKIEMYGGDLSDKPGWRSLLGLPRKRRRWVRALSGVVATSAAIERELLEYGIDPSKIARIPNGVDTDLFRPCRDQTEQRALRERLGLEDRFTIVFSGAVGERKRPHLLVEASAILSRLGQDVQIVLAGPEKDPAYAQRLRSMIDSLNVARQVRIMGFVSDMASLYRAADVFSLPSRGEGMSNALLEAMASGLPAIVTRVSGVTDLIEDGAHGRIVAPRAESIADAIGAYVHHRDLVTRHAVAARERIEQGYSVSRVIESYEAMFRRVMRGEPAAG